MKRARYEALYCDHYPRVLGLCRRILGPNSDPQDAAQEVFERGYRNFRKYRADDPFEHWIGAIARNHCIDLLRQRRRLESLFQANTEEAEAEDPAQEGVGMLISAHTAQAVTAAVDGLTDQYRLPLVLAYYADASYEDIAQTLGISRNHVGVLLLRGKKQLRRALAELMAEGEVSLD